MFSTFPLFQSHLDLAHDLWSKIVKKGDLVIDATCGNGHDTLVLAKLALTESSGALFALDKQSIAITLCKERLAKEFSKELFNRIEFILGCHSIFPDHIPFYQVSLIVYNLGYLPGSDKSEITKVSTTLQSLKIALELVKKGGVISITCYPGHAEGKIEEEKLIEFSKTLNPRFWSVCHHRWINRKESPSLLLLQKAI